MSDEIEELVNAVITTHPGSAAQADAVHDLITAAKKQRVQVPYWLDNCPVCGSKCTGGCRCVLNDRTCTSGHHWRRDDYGDAIVLDGPHGNPVEDN